MFPIVYLLRVRNLIESPAFIENSHKLNTTGNLYPVGLSVDALLLISSLAIAILTLPPFMNGSHPLVEVPPEISYASIAVGGGIVLGWTVVALATRKNLLSIATSAIKAFVFGNPFLRPPETY